MSNSLEDLDPHKYFGTVVPPNCETTPMGVTGTFKVGLGVHHVLTFITYTGEEPFVLTVPMRQKFCLR